MKKFKIFLLFITFFSLTSNSYAIEISSPAFKDGDNIPKKYGCSYNGGKNISIPINFSDVPDNAKSLALIIDDPDAKSVAGKIWVHWILTDIPPNTKSLKEVKNGKVGIGKTGRNSDGKKNYSGMCPPNGTHTYNIKAYALDSEIEKTLGEMTQKKFEKKYKNNIIDSFMFSGKFK